MKRTLLVLFILSVVFRVSGQDNKVKTGWKFGGALPATTYDSDLGFQYGALVEFFNYGDGSTYPDYFDHTYTEVSRYTKGSGIYRMMYESNHLIRGVHLTSDLSYLPDQAYHFYGFNGYESVYNSEWMDQDDSLNYRTRMFYRFERNQFRFKNDLQGKLSGDHLKWSAGFAFQRFQNSSVNIDKLNKGKKKLLPSLADQPGLYERYQVLGLISPDEAEGGWVNTLKAGLMWDSRDNRPNPMRGLWSEIGIEAAPGFMNDQAFAKLFITHRQYFTLIENDLALAYRLGYQSTISGKTPFYYQSQVITSMLLGATSEGLGGGSTLRGVLRNRVLGDAFFMGNVELRWKPFYFKLFNQDCYLGLNAFYDFGRATGHIDLPDDLMTKFNVNYPDENFINYFRLGEEKLHHSAGISIMPVMNRNFVVSVDIGKAFNKQDGNIGFSVGLNYLF